MNSELVQSRTGMPGIAADLARRAVEEIPGTRVIPLVYEPDPPPLPPNVEWERECRKRRRTDRALDGLDLARERMLIRERRSKLPAALRRAVMNSSKGTWQGPEKPNRG